MNCVRLWPVLTLICAVPCVHLLLLEHGASSDDSFFYEPHTACISFSALTRSIVCACHAVHDSELWESILRTHGLCLCEHQHSMSFLMCLWNGLLYAHTWALPHGSPHHFNVKVSHWLLTLGFATPAGSLSKAFRIFFGKRHEALKLRDWWL